MTAKADRVAASREEQRRAFLVRHGLGGVRVEALAPDASFRRYYRIRAEPPRLLMDAPPGREDVRPYVRIARHLRRLGLGAPAVHAVDDALGFVLLQDFGDATFTRLLGNGADEPELYSRAIDVLAALHRHPQATAIDLPPYDAERLLTEALLFTNWYFPARYGSRISAAARDEFARLWLRTFEGLDSLPPTLVLRDFHVDNLMRIEGAHDAGCGLLDFQDALIGSPAYDLVSLLEDARRDLDPALVQAMRGRYESLAPPYDRASFNRCYRLLGAQRHCKVAGIFVRLCIRDRKCQYLNHVPRVLRMLAEHLSHPDLSDLRVWLDRHMPQWAAFPDSIVPEPLRKLLRVA